MRFILKTSIILPYRLIFILHWHYILFDVFYILCDSYVLADVFLTRDSQTLVII